MVVKRIALVLLAAACSASCSSASISTPPAVVQPGAPGSASRAATGPAAAPKFTEADVRFMQGMIGHHAQAIEMTNLLRTRTQRDDMKLLALRIEVSQSDEIRMMQQWLTDRRQEVPAEHAHHAPDAKLMPGMLTPDDLAQLAAARGPEFDKLFLQFMIKHHEGALVMVKELLSQPGAAQEAEIFAFASDVEADQQMEIDRMRAMLFGK
jgi:uncharacterized protein (DUF305 family)